jgi:hypothetical protein
MISFSIIALTLLMRGSGRIVSQICQEHACTLLALHSAPDVASIESSATNRNDVPALHLLTSSRLKIPNQHSFQTTKSSYISKKKKQSIMGPMVPNGDENRRLVLVTCYEM